MNEKEETAVFGGGCFWCTEAVFERLRGVSSVMPGYAGGKTANPTYAQVCSERTGHAEVVRVQYDPARVSFTDLLTFFFATHDPTSLNRQGADVGTQYRSMVLYTTDEQRRQVEEFIADLNRSLAPQRPIVTEVVPLTEFYPAEGYHHGYYNNNRWAPYCQVVIDPKVAKLHKAFQKLLKDNMIESD